MTLVLGVPVVVLLSWPQAFGVERAPVVSQLLAFRVPLALALAFAAAVASAIAAVRRRWAVAAGVAIILIVASVVNVAVVCVRGVGQADVVTTSSLSANDGLTVLVWNTQGGATSPDDVARLVLEVGADIVSLPEMDEVAVAEVARLSAAGGLDLRPGTTTAVADSPVESWIPTSVLIAAYLGRYTVDSAAGSTPGLPSAAWVPVDGTGPTIVTAHPAPPLPDSLDDWRTGLGWIAQRCVAPDVILAGDFNATIDHLDLRHCQDAAAQADEAATGTWPADVPEWLATPIDHVLIGEAWTTRDFQVIRPYRDGSDHRAVVAVLDAR